MSDLKNWTLMKDHPRGCGEHGEDSQTDGVCPGSSPRMRGARMHEFFKGAVPGIIPADAGSTRAACPGNRHRQDHPRGCGEHT